MKKRSMWKMAAATLVMAALIIPEGGILAEEAAEEVKMETEPNEGFGSATPLLTDDVIVGCIDGKEDTDCYSYTIKEDLPYSLFFYNATDNRISYAKLACYDPAMNLMFDEFVGDDAGNYSLKGYFSFPVGQTVYFKVTAESPGTQYSIGIILNEKVENWTAEPNNINTQATPLKKGKKVCDVINCDSVFGASADKDIFVYKAKKKGKTTVSFSLEDDRTNLIGSGWSIKVYDQKGKVVTEQEDVTQDQKFTFKAKKGKKYYITVEASLPYPALGVLYGISVK